MWMSLQGIAAQQFCNQTRKVSRKDVKGRKEKLAGKTKLCGFASQRSRPATKSLHSSAKQSCRILFFWQVFLCDLCDLCDLCEKLFFPGLVAARQRCVLRGSKRRLRTSTAEDAEVRRGSRTKLIRKTTHYDPLPKEVVYSSTPLALVLACFGFQPRERTPQVC